MCDQTGRQRFQTNPDVLLIGRLRKTPSCTRSPRKLWNSRLTAGMTKSRLYFSFELLSEKGFDFFNFCFIFKSYIVFVIHFYFQISQVQHLRCPRPGVQGRKIYRHSSTTFRDQKSAKQERKSKVTLEPAHSQSQLPMCRKFCSHPIEIHRKVQPLLIDSHIPHTFTIKYCNIDRLTTRRTMRRAFHQS